MPENHDALARDFETHRGYLHSVAFQVLASEAEAEDAVQESWLRLCRSDPAGIDDLRAWLTTVVRRICLDKLRARNAMPETPLNVLAANRDDRPPEDGEEPEQLLMTRESIAFAMAIVFDRLTPAQRLPFVLHDAFDIPFDVIARVLGKSPTAVRKQASRARQIILDGAPFSDVSRTTRPGAVEAFLEAANQGRFAELLRVLGEERASRWPDDLAFRTAVPRLDRVDEFMDWERQIGFEKRFDPLATLTLHWQFAGRREYARGWLAALIELASPGSSGR